jgi:hypothetical protein
MLHVVMLQRKETSLSNNTHCYLHERCTRGCALVLRNKHLPREHLHMVSVLHSMLRRWSIFDGPSSFVQLFGFPSQQNAKSGFVILQARVVSMR